MGHTGVLRWRGWLHRSPSRSIIGAQSCSNMWNDEITLFDTDLRISDGFPEITRIRSYWGHYWTTIWTVNGMMMSMRFTPYHQSLAWRWWSSMTSECTQYHLIRMDSLNMCKFPNSLSLFAFDVLFCNRPYSDPFDPFWVTWGVSPQPPLMGYMRVLRGITSL